MHFIVLFNDPKTEKRVDTRDYNMYGLDVGVGNPQPEYDSHHALAEVSILIFL